MTKESHSDPQHYLTAEARARVEIDEQLTATGWAVHAMSAVNLAAAQGVAVREFIFKPPHGRADYLLFVDRQPVGTITANFMFSIPAVAISHKVRWGAGIWLGEVVATFGLLLVIFCLVRSRQKTAVAYAVGAYITGAYWFTSSTSFANPAVTIARTLTDTFAGIAPASALRFIYAQIAGAILAVVVMKVISPRTDAASAP